MTTWLSKQRKVELVDLADEAGYKGAASMLKDDLVDGLAAHLRTNSTKLSRNAAFDEFYSRTTRSPIKKERGSPVLPSDTADLDSRTPKPRRRNTKAPTDFENSTVPDFAATIKSAASHTQAVAEQAIDRITEQFPDVSQYMERMPPLPLPASPAAVTDLVERQTERLAETVNSYWDQWQITPHLHSARTALSTSAAVSLIAVLVEAYGLSRVILPWRYVFSTPAPLNLLYKTPLALHLPDFFVLLTGGFWAPIMLWVVTSLLVPLAAGWFFNFTSAKTASQGRRNHQAARVDPFAYCVAKVLLVWLVFERGFRYGGAFSKATVYIVGGSMPGGHTTALVGAAIGALASLYEAVLRR